MLDKIVGMITVKLFNRFVDNVNENSSRQVVYMSKVYIVTLIGKWHQNMFCCKLFQLSKPPQFYNNFCPVQCIEMCYNCYNLKKNLSIQTLFLFLS